MKYEGKTAQVGDRMNVVKDEKFTGRILDQVQAAIAYVKTQMREYTKLGDGAKFQTIPEYPEFCWTELIVNAVAHRDYSIKGTDIQIKMFDDHMVVESPGILPGIVRVNNIREFHFSRNPKIVELLGEYDLVKEFGEGVDRVFLDMQEAGLPDPVYKQTGFMLDAELRNKNYGSDNGSWEDDGGSDQATTQATTQDTTQVTTQADDEIEQKIIQYCKTPHTRGEIMEFVGLSNRKYFAERYMEPMLATEKIFMTIPDKPNSPKQKYYSKG